MARQYLIVLTSLLLTFTLQSISAQRCVKYVKYQGKNMALRGAKLKHSLVKAAEVDLGELELNNDWRWASEEIQSLDLLQYSICQQLKCMRKGPMRTEVQQRYVDALIEMMSIAFEMREADEGTDAGK